jgi:hypothetical protein
MEENKNASIVIFKNGDQIVCNLKEIFEGEEDSKKGLCLLMVHPYKLSLISLNNNEEQDLQVKFSKWCPYSTDTYFRIPYDVVAAIGACDPGLESAYLAKVAQVEEIMGANAQLQQEEIEKVINPEVMPNE